MHKTPVAIPLLAMLLAGCSPSQPAETVDSLVANPERLKELRRQCREEREKVSDALCEKAAQAFNRRFLGDRPEQKAP
ncbi:hypothetical protein NB699_001566 [Xanthomonas sacchari]|uniref:EexN family lipoprotein n=2 Tax=Pseudomonadota TaxID=1224 RepID=A0AA46SP85_9XANT|nr:EexN family lipoprotein [Xanthomonas sacchari]MCW0366583.1 hypothetical protein [Xanthomonas sacchari]MCW0440392.1 hypothetical protein [Xanthomonas sacchari]UYK87077.1 EexN family lipoprotein [Xanthomonas sacchari]